MHVHAASSACAPPCVSPGLCVHCTAPCSSSGPGGGCSPCCPSPWFPSHHHWSCCCCPHPRHWHHPLHCGLFLLASSSPLWVSSGCCPLAFSSCHLPWFQPQHWSPFLILVALPGHCLGPLPGWCLVLVVPSPCVCHLVLSIVLHCGCPCCPLPSLVFIYTDCPCCPRLVLVPVLVVSSLSLPCLPHRPCLLVLTPLAVLPIVVLHWCHPPPSPHLRCHHCLLLLFLFLFLFLVFIYSMLPHCCPLPIIHVWVVMVLLSSSWCCLEKGGG